MAEKERLLNAGILWEGHTKGGKKKLSGYLNFGVLGQIPILIMESSYGRPGQYNILVSPEDAPLTLMKRFFSVDAPNPEQSGSSPETRTGPKSEDDLPF